MGFDRVARCWRYLVLALIVACSGTAWASFPATASTPAGGCTSAPCYQYNPVLITDYGSTLGTWYSTPADAAAAAVAAANASTQWWRYSVVSAGSSSYVFSTTQVTTGNNIGNDSRGMSTREVAPTPPSYSCPSHSLLNGSMCTCDSGYTENGGQCINNTQQKKCSDAKDGSDWFSGFSSLPNVGSAFCPSDGAASSCGTTVSGGYCTIKAGVKSCAYEVKYTGATCTPPSSSTEQPVQDPCKGSSGTVNGKTVCIPLGSDPSVTVETKKTTTDSKTTTDASGSGTSTSTKDAVTSCSGNTCTTTTTTTTTSASGGTTTTADTKTEPKEDFCTENPQAAVCKNSTFGGSCSAAFTCDGDAIQCAMAKDQLQRNCQALDADTDANSVTNQALSGADKLNTGEMRAEAKANPVQVGSFNTSGRGWSRSCPADPVIAIPWARGNNTQFTIPFSRACGSLALLANAAVAITLLGSLAWVVGGSKAAA